MNEFAGDLARIAIFELTIPNYPSGKPQRCLPTYAQRWARGGHAGTDASAAELEPAVGALALSGARGILSRAGLTTDRDAACYNNTLL